MTPGPGSTDLWFRTDLGLTALAAALGAAVLVHDAEDFWEWVIAEWEGVQLDLTRPHTVPAAAFDTRIFRWDGDRRLPDEVADRLAGRLVGIGIAPVSVGRLSVVGKDYHRTTHRTIG